MITTAARYDNPVLTKELRTRMRGARAYGVIFAHVMLLSGALFFTYLFQYQRLMGAGFRPSVGADPVGRLLFQVLFGTQGVLLALITPALTAGMITIEREQRTYELLMLTILRPREIAAGKLLSAFGFAVLLLTASLPLAGICYMMGGVSEWEILIAYLLLAASSLLYAAVGLLLSASLRTTSTATATTYMVAAVLFIATFAAGTGQKEVLFSATNPIWACINTLEKGPFFRWHVPVWIPSLLLSLVTTLLAAAGAVHRLEEGFSERPGTLRWLTYALFVVLAAGVVGNIAGLLTPGANTRDLGMTTSTLSILLLVSLALLAVLFCSADGKEIWGPPAEARGGAGGGLAARMARLPLFAGGFATAPAYLALLYVTGAAFVAAAFPLTGITTWLLVIDDIAAALLVTTAVVGFIIALARLFSILTESRNVAALLTILGGGILMVLPLFSLVGWDSSVKQPHSAAWETLYLNPIWALLSLGMAPGEWERIAPPVWAGQSLFWVVTTFLYVGLAAAAGMAGQLALRKGRARRKAAEPTPPAA